MRHEASFILLALSLGSALTACVAALVHVTTWHFVIEEVTMLPHIKFEKEN